MTTDSQARRYRDSYAAGHRDGSVPSSEEDALQMRRLTGDDWSDDGYAAGFGAGRRAMRRNTLSGVGHLIGRVPWIHDILRWLRKVSGSRRAL